jgi:hypothetical protein
VIRNLEVQELLAKARDAEQRAALTADQANKADWLRVARGYYELAEGVVLTANIVAAFDKPLPLGAFQKDPES